MGTGHLDARALAEDAFGKAWTAWNNLDATWIHGHSLDTLLDYFFDKGTPELDPLKVLTTAKEAYEKVRPREDPHPGESYPTFYWYDDWGWWGIAWLKAAELAEAVGGRLADRRAQFLADAEYCLMRMRDHAPRVWDFLLEPAHLEQRKYFSALEPLYPGGAWNCYLWNKLIDPKGKPPNDDEHLLRACSDLIEEAKAKRPKNQVPYGGIQNSVTNGLYAVLGARYYNCSNTQEGWRAVESHRQWMKAWLAPGKQGHLRSEVGEQGEWIVRERVGLYKEAAADEYGYDPENSWAGDCGLFFGALLDLTLSGLAPEAQFSLTAPDLVGGVMKTMTTEQGSLAPWKPSESRFFCNTDPDDYLTGPGVFMRYLLYGWRRLCEMGEGEVPETQALLRSLYASADLRGFVEATLADEGLEPEDRGPRLVYWTNRLAIANMARALTEEERGSGACSEVLVSSSA